MSNTAAHTLVIIPCAAAKLDVPAAARDLYASDNFKHMLAAAEAHAADDAAYFGHTTKVMILSAEHGLLDLDTVVAPYDTKMGDKGCITADVVRDQLIALAPEAVAAMLPSAYFQRLWEAVTDLNENGADTDPWIDLSNAYEAAPGIGYQRGVASALAREAAAA
jgi:hypothetical protein